MALTTIGRGSIEMTIAMLISGTIGWFVLISGLPILDVVFWRCVFGASTLLVICAILGVIRPRIISLKLFGLTVLGGVLLVLNWVVLFNAYSYSSISIATTIYNTQPFILFAFGVFFFGERFTQQKLLWLALSFSGLLMIVMTKPTTSDSGSHYLFGILLAFLAAFMYALIAVITKYLKGVPTYLITLIQVSVGVLMLAPWANFETLPQQAGQWLSLITLGMLHTGVMYILLYSAVQKLPTHLIGSLSFIYPVAAIVVDKIAFDQQLNTIQLIGIAAILFAAAGMNLGWQFRLWPKAKA